MRLQPDDFSGMEAAATVIRIAEGNFCCVHCLCIQVEHMIQIDEVRMVTKEVVEVAREH